jgi:hypothetical protein
MRKLPEKPNHLRLIKSSKEFEVDIGKSAAEKYQECLENPVLPGNGCHQWLLKVANYACFAGLPKQQCFNNLRKLLVNTTRPVTDQEIWDAIEKAYSEGGTNVKIVKTKPLIENGEAALRKIIAAGKHSTFEELRKNSPIVIPPNAREQQKLFFETMFDPKDLVFCGASYSSGPALIRPVSFWIQHSAGGPFIIVNPLTGEPAAKKSGTGQTYRGDNCVAAYKYCLVEFDGISLEDQIRFWSNVPLPVKALIFTGSKSIHGWLDLKGLNIRDANDWQKKIKISLYKEILEPLGVDSACSNAARLARLPGCFRSEKQKMQELLWIAGEGRTVEQGTRLWDALKMQCGITPEKEEEIRQTLNLDEKITETIRLASLVPHDGLFHDPDGVAYCSVKIRDHIEIIPLESTEFQSWLSYTSQKEHEKIPSTTTLRNVITSLKGHAKYKGPVRQVYVRHAFVGGKIYINTGWDNWEVIEISRDGWKITHTDAVCFRRPTGIGALPRPSTDGDISALSEVIRTDLPIAICWLLVAWAPIGPYLIALIQGPQGSGKTQTSHFLRRLVDPSSADLVAPPKDEHDIIIAARNSWVVALDNLSRLPAELGDALCRLASGTGIRTRKLYTNAEEDIFAGARPIIVNGISDLTSRSDFVDRTIAIELQKPEVYLSEKELFRKFDAVAPVVLGGLLNTCVSGLRYLDDTRLENAPRMADALIWCQACERGGTLPWGEGTIVAQFAEQADTAVRSFMEGDEVASEIMQFMKSQPTGTWEGTMADLLKAVNENRRSLPGKTWPDSVYAFRSRFRRAEDAMVKCGLRIKTRKSHGQLLVSLSIE